MLMHKPPANVVSHYSAAIPHGSQLTDKLAEAIRPGLKTAYR